MGLHFIQNLVGGILFGAMFNQPDNLLWTGLLAVFYGLWAIFLALKLGPSLGHPVRTT